MMNCLPTFLVNAAVKGRANASVPPPGGKGTTMVTGLVGQPLCAWAMDVASARVSARVVAAMKPAAAARGSLRC